MFHHVRTLRLIWLRYSLASVAIISLAAPLTKAGQQQPAQGQSYLVPTTSSAPNTNTEPMMPMPLVFPLFIEDRHFTSTLVMINGLSVSTFADVTLRDLNGAEISRQRIDFEPHSQQRLEVSKALLVAGSRATIGSIVLTEPSDRAGTAILAQLTMTYTGLAGPNYLDEEASMPDSGGSQILRGVTGESKGSPIVSIVSLSDVPQNVTIQCLSRFGVTFSKSVHLFTKETILTEACTSQSVYASDLDIIGDSDSRAIARHATGIALTTDGAPGSFAAFGLARNSGNLHGHYSAFGFDDPKMAMSATRIFTGVPVGSATLLPDGRYVPHIYIANFSSKSSHVTVHYSQMINNAPSARTVAELILPPIATRELALDILEGDASMRNSFVVSSDSAPGDMAVKLVSTSEGELPEVGLEAKDELDPENGGNHPWSLEHGTKSTLLLFDPTKDSQIFNVVISGGGRSWSKAYTLASMQTLVIGIGDLIAARSVDDFGLVLPRGLLNGEVSWFTSDSRNGKGRLLQSNRDLAMARNFSCGTIIVMCSVGFGISGTDFTDGGGDAFGNMNPHFCRSSGPTNCPGDNVAAATGATYSWWSDATSIAAISGSNTNPTSSVIGVSPNSTTIHGQATYKSCSAGGSGPANVFAGVLTAQDNFSGRNMSKFGIAEVINLSFTSQQTAAALGGLQWSVVSGGGSLSGAGTDGKGTYTAPAAAATVVLRLSVASGSSQGRHRDYTISIVAPSGVYLVKFSNVRHTMGFISVGFQAHVYVTPTDVSFANLKVGEGTTNAVATGYFANKNGEQHPAGPYLQVHGCNVNTGCTAADDTVDTGNNPPPFSVGDYLWAIPTQYQVGSGALITFTTANHHQTASGTGTTGTGSIEKAGAGPFVKNASDPTTTF